MQTAYNYDFAKMFSRFPGGRLSQHGPKSGEEFREKHLVPILQKYDKITIDLTGVAGFGSSFLDESFAEAAKIMGKDKIHSVLEIKCSDDPLLVRMIWEKIDSVR